jgi:hypothetical protein
LYSNGSHNIYLTKLDSSGAAKWAKVIADTAAPYSLCMDACGYIWLSGSMNPGYNIDGHHFSMPIGSVDAMFIACWDANGSFVNAALLPSGSDDNNTITSDSKGNIYVCGDYEQGPYTIGNTTLPFDIIPGATEDLFVAKYSHVLCVPESVFPKEVINEVAIFPNPAHEEFIIDAPGYLNENISVQLYNILGQIVYQSLITKQQTIISTTSLPAGMYICKVSANGQGVFIKKILIEK